MAGKSWSGWPNASSESGWTWNSMLGVSNIASDFMKIPSWLGAMDIGPERLNAYSSAMRALPASVDCRSFSVRAPVILKAVRICRWSCRFSPTAGMSRTTGMPCACKSEPAPSPESWRS